jgi:hypothetical protein
MEGAVMGSCCGSCADKSTLSGHPNTVRAPRVPLYQLGWLGDSTDVYGPPETIDTAALNADTGLGPGMDVTNLNLTFPDPSSPDTPVNPNSGVIFGPPGPGQPGGVPVSAAGSITSAIASLFSPKSSSLALPPGPSPRVAAPATGIAAMTASLGSSLPIIALGIVGFVVLSNMGGRRRR